MILLNQCIIWLLFSNLFCFCQEDQNVRKGSWTESSRKFTYNLIRTLCPSRAEIIFIVEDGEDFQIPSDEMRYLSVFNMKALLRLKFDITSKLFRNHRCLVFLPFKNNLEPQKTLQDFAKAIEKVDQEMFSQYTKKQYFFHKPILIFIYPELLVERFTKHQGLSLVQNLFGNTSNFLIDSEVFFALVSQPYRFNEEVMRAFIWEIYSFKGHRFYKVFNVMKGNIRWWDEWYPDSSDGFPHLAVRRENLEGLPIVGTTKQTKWSILKKIDGKLFRLVGGTAANWFWDLEKALNFELQIIEGGDIKTLKNNTLTGKSMVQINSGEADISLVLLLVVDFRARNVEFLQPIYSSLINVFFKQPSSSLVRNIVTSPFHPGLWITLVSTWIGVSLIVKLGVSILDKHTRIMGPGNPCGNNKNGVLHDSEFADSFVLWTVAANCQKAWYTSPLSTPFRIIFLVGWFSGVMVYTAYSGAIVSSLALHSDPVENFVDLINYKALFTVHNMSEPFKQILQHLINLFHLNQQVETVETEDEISHLLQPRTLNAFLSYPDIFYYTASSLNYTNVQICNTISKVQFGEYRYKSAAFLKKASPLKEVFNHKLLIMRERGFNYRYTHHYDRANILSCIRESHLHELEPIEFMDIFSVFFFFSQGIIAAFVHLLWEILFRKLSKVNR